MVFLFFAVFILFGNIDISSESGAVIGMINVGMVLYTIIFPIEVARGPIKSKFLL